MLSYNRPECLPTIVGNPTVAPRPIFVFLIANVINCI